MRKVGVEETKTTLVFFVPPRSTSENLILVLHIFVFEDVRRSYDGSPVVSLYQGYARLVVYSVPVAQYLQELP